MHKRVTIAVALLLVAGAAYFFLPPKDTVEYHKRHYYKARQGLTWREELHDAWERATGKPVMGSRQRTDEERARAARHLQALIRLGYFEEKTFVVSNQPMTNVVRAAIQGWYNAFPTGTIPMLRSTAFEDWPSEYVLVQVRDESSNRITIVATPNDMPKWEQIVRKADSLPDQAD